MSPTRPPDAQAGDARIIEAHDVAGPDGEDEIDATEGQDGAGTTSGRSPAAAPTSGASTPHGGWRWDGLCSSSSRFPWPWW